MKMSCNEFSPVDLLCMQRKPSMSLANFFATHNPKAFSDLKLIDTVAMYSESLEMLQFMLQQTSSIVHSDTSWLFHLCRREEFPAYSDMISYLIEADSSQASIAGAIKSMIWKSSPDEYAETMLLNRLLNACSSAATLCVHQLCKKREVECLKYLRLLNSVQVGIFEQLDEDNFLPVHFAAEYSTVDVLEYLLHEYPESLHMTTLQGYN
jgi:hypothetical protein